MILAVFLAGWISCTAVRSLYEDSMGKESYMRLVDVTWVSAVYTVPIALVLLIFGLGVLAMALKGGRAV